MRCFIAIDLPEEMKAKLFHDFDNLKRRRFFIGKNTQKNNLHLTLNFLGELTDDEIEKVENSLRKIKFPKFSCSFGKLGFFDNIDRINVIWIEIISKNLIQLEKEITAVLGNSEKFVPHVTLSRIKKVFNKKKLAEGIGKFNFKGKDFVVGEFLLMKSELTKDGLKYKVLEKFPLS